MNTVEQDTRKRWFAYNIIPAILRHHRQCFFIHFGIGRRLPLIHSDDPLVTPLFATTVSKNKQDASLDNVIEGSRLSQMYLTSTTRASLPILDDRAQRRSLLNFALGKSQLVTIT